MRISFPKPFHCCSYGMSVTTLEEVFLRVANGTADVEARKNLADISLQRRKSQSESTMMRAETVKVCTRMTSFGVRCAVVRDVAKGGASRVCAYVCFYILMKRSTAGIEAGTVSARVVQELDPEKHLHIFLFFPGSTAFFFWCCPRLCAIASCRNSILYESYLPFVGTIKSRK